MEIGDLPPSPCDFPETRDEINADAAAAAALKEAMRRMELAGEDFGTREYSALLVRNPDGTISFARMKAGPGGGQGPTLDLEGLDFSTVVGLFHTHPSGEQTINSWDWSEVYRAYFRLGTEAGGDMTHLRTYVATLSISYNNVTKILNVWKGGDYMTLTPVAKVNPNALPCGS